MRRVRGTLVLGLVTALLASTGLATEEAAVTLPKGPAPVLPLAPAGVPPTPPAAPDPPPADTSAAPSAGVPVVIPGSRAIDHVGQEVTIEGRVHATHDSQLATVLAFAPNFAGFTAKILAADREKFPADVADSTRQSLVRVTGRIDAYRGKPEMTLREPGQLTIVSAAPRPAPPAATAGRDPDLDDTIARLEARIAALEARVVWLEQPPPRLAVDMSAAEVRALLGEPVAIGPGVAGGPVWTYGGGARVAFGPSGRVVGWNGF